MNDINNNSNSLKSVREILKNIWIRPSQESNQENLSVKEFFYVNWDDEAYQNDFLG